MSQPAQNVIEYCEKQKSHKMKGEMRVLNVQNQIDCEAASFQHPVHILSTLDAYRKLRRCIAVDLYSLFLPVSSESMRNEESQQFLNGR